MQSLFNIVILIIIVGCGTIVGNPKKPDGGDTETGTHAYAIPEISFSLPEVALSEEEESTLALTSSDPSETFFLQASPGILKNRSKPFGAKKALLADWAQRFQKIIGELNRVSSRINLISKAIAPDSEGTLRFRDKGFDSGLSGKIERSGDGEFSFSAVFCHFSQPFIALKWSNDGKKIKYIRDFTQEAEESRHALGQFKTEVDLRLEADEIQLAMYTQGPAFRGLFKGANGEEGLAESAQVIGKPDGSVWIRAVNDRYREMSGEEGFEGDVYLTGKLTPVPQTEQERPGGARHFESEFLGYRKGNTLCSSEFLETGSIWDAEALGETEGGWCIGRPAGKRSFESDEDLTKTLASLKEVGFQSRDSLRTVEISGNHSCE